MLFNSQWEPRFAIAARQERWLATRPIIVTKVKPRQLNKDKRRHLVATVLAILESGTPTKFAYEASCRYGLRRTFCVEGWPFHEADATAADIVSTALRRIGAQRPTWQQGQPEWQQFGYAPVEYTRCLHCGGAIPPDRGSRNGSAVKYCSALCGQAAYMRKARRSGERMTMAEHLAALAARKKRTYLEREKQCEQCGQTFHPGYAVNRQRFCCLACAKAGQSRPRRSNRACVRCGATFKPKHAAAKYCSTACYEHRGHSKHSGEERTCLVCQTVFRAKATLTTRTCSPACGYKFRKDNRRGR
jgi:hypothetical protein